jgi:rhomboid protease GluP
LALPYRWQWRFERWKSVFRGLVPGLGGRGGEQPRPKLCPVCGTLVGISATRCHECGTSLRFSLAAASKGLSRFFGGRAPVTGVLLIVNMILFALSWIASASLGSGGFSPLWSMNNEALFRLGANVPFGSGWWSWYRPVTAMFLHGGLLHIGFNMMVLLDIGPVVEEVYGSANYLFLYLATGVAASAASSEFGRHLSIGASGALMGLIGLLIAITTRRAGAQMKQLRSHLISWVVSIFVIGLFPGLSVDNWAHGGGLLAGFVLGKLWIDHQPATPGERRLSYALGWLAAAAIVACFAGMLVHYRGPLPG